MLKLLKNNLLSFSLICLGISWTWLRFFPSLSLAERLESASFVIQMGNLNMGGGQQDSAAYKLTSSTGQTGAGPFDGLNQFLGSGFQYIYTIDSFRFAISKLNIDFGTLIIGNHSTDSLTLTLDTKGAGGYTVYAYELTPLKHQNGLATIPNTSCDSADCTFSTAKQWTNQSIPGFGFNAAGNHVATDFLSADYFRPFADQSAGQAMKSIMTAADIATQEQAVLTYKVGISATQAAGYYQTGVVFVAVPGF